MPAVVITSRISVAAALLSDQHKVRVTRRVRDACCSDVGQRTIQVAARSRWTGRLDESVLVSAH